MSGPTFANALVVIAGTLLCAAALHDVAFRTVPNWVCLILAGTAAALRATQGTLIASGCVGLVVLLAAVFCWRRGWLGGGDVKLLAASTMLVPPLLAAELLLQVALAGGVLAVLYLALGSVVSRPPAARPSGLARRIWRAERYRMHRRGPLPYATAIAAGAGLMLVKG